MSDHLLEVRIVAVASKERVPRPVYGFLVRIKSNVKDNLWTNVTLEPSKYKSSGETLRAVEVAGCAAAEHQCAEYGDHIDCERAGRIALEIFKRLMLEIHNKSISIVQLSRMSHVSGPGLFHQETV